MAELSKAKAEAELAQLMAGPSEVDLQQAKMAVLTAQAAVEKAQADLRAANLTAPFGGSVLEVRAAPGELVCPSDGLIVLIDPNILEVESTVIEEDLPLVQVGQRAELFFDAQPDALVSGHVSRIVLQRNPASDRPLYPVYFELDDLPEGLAPGMTVDASVIIAQRTDVLRLPRTVAHAGPDGAAQIKVWAGGQIEMRTVKIGLRGDVHVEILEGLLEGDEVAAQ
jgi:RND family efflux transporter MFP subunit